MATDMLTTLDRNDSPFPSLQCPGSVLVQDIGDRCLRS